MEEKKSPELLTTLEQQKKLDEILKHVEHTDALMTRERNVRQLKMFFSVLIVIVTLYFSYSWYIKNQNIFFEVFTTTQTFVQKLIAFKDIFSNVVNDIESLSKINSK
ncbi:MAG: hypothetical protein QM526_02285 [Alphaproteobacteria bacterium]|nr:hypothetical protein [Alphaproteobacteria bacterium]